MIGMDPFDSLVAGCPASFLEVATDYASLDAAIEKEVGKYGHRADHDFSSEQEKLFLKGELQRVKSSVMKHFQEILERAKKPIRLMEIIEAIEQRAKPIYEAAKLRNASFVTQQERIEETFKKMVPLATNPNLLFNSTSKKNLSLKGALASIKQEPLVVSEFYGSRVNDVAQTQLVPNKIIPYSATKVVLETAAENTRGLMVALDIVGGGVVLYAFAVASLPLITQIALFAAGVTTIKYVADKAMPDSWKEGIKNTTQEVAKKYGISEEKAEQFVEDIKTLITLPAAGFVSHKGTSFLSNLKYPLGPATVEKMTINGIDYAIFYQKNDPVIRVYTEKVEKEPSTFLDPMVKAVLEEGALRLGGKREIEIHYITSNAAGMVVVNSATTISSSIPLPLQTAPQMALPKREWTVLEGGKTEPSRVAPRKEKVCACDIEEETISMKIDAEDLLQQIPDKLLDQEKDLVESFGSSIPLLETLPEDFPITKSGKEGQFLSDKGNYVRLKEGLLSGDFEPSDFTLSQLGPRKLGSLKSLILYQIFPETKSALVVIDKKPLLQRTSMKNVFGRDPYWYPTMERSRIDVAEAIERTVDHCFELALEKGCDRLFICYDSGRSPLLNVLMQKPDKYSIAAGKVFIENRSQTQVILEARLLKQAHNLQSVLAHEKQYLDRMYEELDKIPLDVYRTPSERDADFNAAMAHMSDESTLRDYMRSHTKERWEYGSSGVFGRKLDSGEIVIEKNTFMQDPLSIIQHLHYLKKAGPKEFAVSELLGMDEGSLFLTYQSGMNIDQCVGRAARDQNYDALYKVFRQMGRALGEMHSLYRIPIPQEYATAGSLLEQYDSNEEDASRFQEVLPHTRDELGAYIRAFEKMPRVAVLANDDPSLVNAIWDSELEQLSFIDIGSNGYGSPYSLLSMAHPAENVYRLIHNMEQTFRHYRVPKAEQKRQLLAFYEGYSELSQVVIPREALQMFQAIALYNDPNPIPAGTATQVKEACAFLAKEKQSSLILEWPSAGQASAIALPKKFEPSLDHKNKMQELFQKAKRIPVFKYDKKNPYNLCESIKRNHISSFRREFDMWARGTFPLEAVEQKGSILEILQKVKAFEILRGLDLKHVQIPEVWDVEFEGDIATLIRPYIEGKTISAWLETKQMENICLAVRLWARGLAEIQAKEFGKYPIPQQDIVLQVKELENLYRELKGEIPVLEQRIIEDYTRFPGMYTHGLPGSGFKSFVTNADLLLSEPTAAFISAHANLTSASGVPHVHPIAELYTAFADLHLKLVKDGYTPEQKTVIMQEFWTGCQELWQGSVPLEGAEFQANLSLYRKIKLAKLEEVTSPHESELLIAACKEGGDLNVKTFVENLRNPFFLLRENDFYLSLPKKIDKVVREGDLIFSTVSLGEGLKYIEVTGPFETVYRKRDDIVFFEEMRERESSGKEVTCIWKIGMEDEQASLFLTSNSQGRSFEISPREGIHPNLLELSWEEYQNLQGACRAFTAGFEGKDSSFEYSTWKAEEHLEKLAQRKEVSLVRDPPQAWPEYQERVFIGSGKDAFSLFIRRADRDALPALVGFLEHANSLNLKHSRFQKVVGIEIDVGGQDRMVLTDPGGKFFNKLLEDQDPAEFLLALEHLGMALQEMHSIQGRVVSEKWLKFEIEDLKKAYQISVAFAREHGLEMPMDYRDVQGRIQALESVPLPKRSCSAMVYDLNMVSWDPESSKIAFFDQGQTDGEFYECDPLYVFHLTQIVLDEKALNAGRPLEARQDMLAAFRRGYTKDPFEGFSKELDSFYKVKAFFSETGKCIREISMVKKRGDLESKAEIPDLISHLVKFFKESAIGKDLKSEYGDLW